MLHRGAQRVVVARHAEAANNAHREIGKIGFVSEWLPGMHVGEVHLDKGKLCAGQRVAKRDAGVGKSAWINDHEVRALCGGMNAIDELAFMIALKALDIAAELCAKADQACVDVLQGAAPVDLRLPCAEEIEIGTVNDEYPCHRSSCPEFCASVAQIGVEVQFLGAFQKIAAVLRDLAEV